MITCLYLPISGVKQRAGLTFEALVSSKGNGTSMIEFLIIQGLSIIQRIDIFGGII